MVTVIGPQELQTLQPSSPDDILRFVPNVEFLGGPRRTGEVPSIRGFSGPDVIILFDGARQNYKSGHDGQFFIDPSVLKTAQVLRGPARPEGWRVGQEWFRTGKSRWAPVTEKKKNNTTT